MRFFLRLSGVLLCVLPPVISILEYFPLWLGNGRTALSAISVLLLLLAAIPLVRVVKNRLRSPSAWMLWLGLWLFMILFRPIAASVETIALISFPTSLAGALCFRIADRKKQAN